MSDGALDEALPEGMFKRDGASSAIRFNGRPFIMFWNGNAWDCEPVPGKDLARFESLAEKWEAVRMRRIEAAIALKKPHERD